MNFAAFRLVGPPANTPVHITFFNTLQCLVANLNSAVPPAFVCVVCGGGRTRGCQGGGCEPGPLLDLEGLVNLGGRVPTRQPGTSCCNGCN